MRRFELLTLSRSAAILIFVAMSMGADEPSCGAGGRAVLDEKESLDKVITGRPLQSSKTSAQLAEVIPYSQPPVSTCPPDSNCNQSPTVFGTNCSTSTLNAWRNSISPTPPATCTTNDSCSPSSICIRSPGVTGPSGAYSAFTCAPVLTTMTKPPGYGAVSTYPPYSEVSSNGVGLTLSTGCGAAFGVPPIKFTDSSGASCTSILEWVDERFVATDPIPENKPGAYECSLGSGTRYDDPENRKACHKIGPKKCQWVVSMIKSSASSERGRLIGSCEPAPPTPAPATSGGSASAPLPKACGSMQIQECHQNEPRCFWEVTNEIDKEASPPGGEYVENASGGLDGPVYKPRAQCVEDTPAAEIKAAYGADCARSYQCATGLVCLKRYPWEPKGVCTKSCMTSQNCPNGEECRTYPIESKAGAFSYCVPHPDDTGHAFNVIPTVNELIQDFSPACRNKQKYFNNDSEKCCEKNKLLKFKASDNKCVCIDNSMVWKSDGSGCQCPSGFRLSGTKCVPDTKSCTCGTLRSSYTQGALASESCSQYSHSTSGYPCCPMSQYYYPGVGCLDYSAALAQECTSTGGIFMNGYCNCAPPRTQDAMGYGCVMGSVTSTPAQAPVQNASAVPAAPQPRPTVAAPRGTNATSPASQATPAAVQAQQNVNSTTTQVIQNTQNVNQMGSNVSATSQTTAQINQQGAANANAQLQSPTGATTSGSAGSSAFSQSLCNAGYEMTCGACRPSSYLSTCTGAKKIVNGCCVDKVCEDYRASECPAEPKCKTENLIRCVTPPATSDPGKSAPGSSKATKNSK